MLPTQLEEEEKRKDRKPEEQSIQEPNILKMKSPKTENRENEGEKLSSQGKKKNHTKITHKQGISKLKF